MLNHDSDIKGFNRHYLQTVKTYINMGRVVAMQTFQLDAMLVDTLSKYHDWDRLVISDCTLIHQNVDLSHFRSSSSPSSPDLEKAALDEVQSVNYQYLMLARHLAATNIREAMLRTGVEYKVALMLRDMPAHDVRSLALHYVGVMGKCHLTAKAVAAALSSTITMPQFVPMFSMRGALCLAH